MLVYQCTKCKAVFTRATSIKCKVCKGTLERTVVKPRDNGLNEVKQVSTIVNRNKASVVQRVSKPKVFVEPNLAPLEPRALYSFLASFRNANLKEPPTLRMKAFTAAMVAMYLHNNQNIPLPL